MTIPPIGNVAALQGATTGSLSQTAGARQAGLANAGEAGLAIAPEAGPANAGEAQAAGSPGATGASGEGSFSGALGQALNALEGSQAAGESAASQVATGTTSNPEGAVVKVMDAELEMQLASQVRSKATEALQTIFQTQV
jgi:flagellar hook-basal body complex protein FliE